MQRFLQPFCIAFFIITSLLHSKEVIQFTGYPELCLQALEDPTVFDTFRIDSRFNEALGVSASGGKGFLEQVDKRYPDLLPLLTECHVNDLMGSPTLIDCKDAGAFSAETLKYFKIAGDLKFYFGDLSGLRVVEIGGGFGGQCCILNALGGWASYTIVDLPECNALTRVYLEKLGIDNVTLIDIDSLTVPLTCDLAISNYRFSEMEAATQQKCFDLILEAAPNGYLTLDFISNDFKIKSISLDALIAMLYKAGKKGVVDREWPFVKRKNQVVKWRTLEGLHVYETKEDPFPSQLKENGNAVTYSFNNGRFGDNLVSYIHAKWIAYQYGLPLLFVPFPYSDSFCCHYQEPFNVGVDRSSFASFMTIMSNKQLPFIPGAKSTLITVPFTPDGFYDHHHLARKLPYYYVDWDDPVFKEEIRRCLQQVAPPSVIDFPENRITVAMHLRRGGGHDKPDSYKVWPLKFPLMRYYYEQLSRLIEILDGAPLYVHIFTDDLHPEELIQTFKKDFKKKGDIIFGGRTSGNGPKNNVMDDFYMFTQFDCLIRGDSNFSMVASKLADYRVEFYPEDCYWEHGLPIIDKVAIRFGEFK